MSITFGMMSMKGAGTDWTRYAENNRPNLFVSLGAYAEFEVEADLGRLFLATRTEIRRQPSARPK
jgi:hypothetical protein